MHKPVVAGRPVLEILPLSHLTGNLTVTDKLEIGASARLRGRVTARRIAIALGAQVEGEMACTGAEAIVEFTERRAAVPEG